MLLDDARIHILNIQLPYPVLVCMRQRRNQERAYKGDVQSLNQPLSKMRTDPRGLRSQTVSLMLTFAKASIHLEQVESSFETQYYFLLFRF